MSEMVSPQNKWRFGSLLRRMVSRLRRLQRISPLESFRVMVGRRVPLYYAHSKSIPNNFGDVLNPWLFGRFSGLSPVSCQYIVNVIKKPTYVFIGSILDDLQINNSVICGAGFIQEDSRIHYRPWTVLAVRGPLSRKILLDHGIACPTVYGDPALLLPDFYSPRTTKELDVGIIAHYADKGVLRTLRTIDGGLKYKIIDIESGIENVMDDIARCSCILSSSLHGIITAHAFGIPATWVKFSDQLLGGDFKFHDYSLGVAGVRMVPSIICAELDLNQEVARAVLLDTKKSSAELRAVFSAYFAKRIR